MRTFLLHSSGVHTILLVILKICGFLQISKGFHIQLMFLESLIIFQLVFNLFNTLTSLLLLRC